MCSPALSGPWEAGYGHSSRNHKHLTFPLSPVLFRPAPLRPARSQPPSLGIANLWDLTADCLARGVDKVTAPSSSSLSAAASTATAGPPASAGGSAGTLTPALNSAMLAHKVLHEGWLAQAAEVSGARTLSPLPSPSHSACWRGPGDTGPCKMQRERAHCEHA